MKILNIGKDRKITDVSINFIIAAYFVSVAIMIVMGIGFMTAVAMIIAVGILRAMDIHEPRIVMLNGRYKVTAEILTPNYCDDRYIYDIEQVDELKRFVQPRRIDD